MIIRARQRCYEGDDVIDIPLGQGERLDILIEIGILQPVALVVVIHDVPECQLRAVVKIRTCNQYVSQIWRLEGGNVGLFLGDQEATKR